MKHGIFGGKSGRIMPVVLAVMILTTSATAVAAAATVTTDGTDSYISAFAKSGESGTAITFSSEDFLGNIVGSGKLEGIVLTTLPDKTEGTLFCGNREMYAGEAVTTQNLDSLYFQPTGTEETTATFSFIPVFTDSNGEITTVSVAQVKKENAAPTANDSEFETVKNIAVTCKFKCMDPDGDAIVCKIQSAPKKGDAIIPADNPTSFVYTPYQNKTGTDTFTFVAVDPDGKTSAAAKVTIRITKNGAKMTYADMEGNSAHFAAIKLAEDGILIGERMGECYFFDPDKVVSRGEFVAMALTCLGTEISTPVTKTGFADDSDTPAWVKPYISTALKNGIITGVSTSDGRKVFRSETALTRAEAAVIINNAIALSDADREPVFADSDALPAWASEAAANTAARGILSVTSDGNLRPMDSVTRADAAQMLYNAMQVIKDDQSKGLLSRLFG